MHDFILLSNKAFNFGYFLKCIILISHLLSSLLPRVPSVWNMHCPYGHPIPVELRGLGPPTFTESLVGVPNGIWLYPVLRQLQTE